jgi:hypothetical protein
MLKVAQERFIQDFTLMIWKNSLFFFTIYMYGYGYGHGYDMDRIYIYIKQPPYI